MHKNLFFFILICFAIPLTLSTCGKDDKMPGPMDTTQVDPKPFDINSIHDTYEDVAALSLSSSWGPYNTHDPSILNDGTYFYCFSTDAAYGVQPPAGIQERKSKDLIDWKFVGWAISSLPTQGANFISSNGGTPFNSLWAPYIMKISGSSYRLYYSLSSAVPRLSAIGLFTSKSANGPWSEKGVVVTSVNDNTTQTNAIDPTVLVDKQGDYWMYYGSAWDGIYILKLNPDTGLALTPGDKGTRVAQRGFTGETINGNIEGSEIIYNPELDKYFLFIAYDWLETKYNVRVGRADSPEGPFHDFNGHDLNNEEDNLPMILAPYKFKNHGGWQGTAHVTVFRDGDQYFMGHQGRPGVNKYFMVLHVRKIFWTADGWPVVSPERYAGTEQTSVSADELTGTWEYIHFTYRVVPGFADEQTSPDFSESIEVILNNDNTINSDAASTWTYAPPLLTMNWSDGHVDNVIVSRGRDWENKKADALVFTGLGNDGLTSWGKK